MNKVKHMNGIFLATAIIAVVAPYISYLVPSVMTNDLAAIIYAQLLLVLPALCYLIFTKQNIKELIRFRKIKPVNVILLVLFAYLITPLMGLINAISLLFSTNVIDDTIKSIVSKNPLWVALLAVAFLPCMLEESVYRGVFFNEYRKVNPLKGVLLSALLFGLMHRNLNQFMYAFAMGTIFALVIEATDSILSTMIIHFVINGTSVVLTFLIPKLQAYASAIYGKEMATQMFSTDVELNAKTLLPAIISYAVISVFTTSLAFMLFMLIAKIQGRLDYVKSIFVKEKRDLVEVEGEKKQDRLISIPLVIGVVICIVSMILVEI